MTLLDAIPGAIESHIDVAREREQAREQARLARRNRRGNLRVVRQTDVG